MSRLIDAEELITILDEELQKGSSLSKVLLVGFAKQILNDAPTVDAEPIRHGKWIKKRLPHTDGGTYEIFMCTECNEGFNWRTNYCPNCGAKMDEVTE